MNEWKLSGSANGRVYDTRMTFIRKEEKPNPEYHIKQYLKIKGKTNNPEYRKRAEISEYEFFETEAGDKIEVTPRYVGSRLGLNLNGEKGKTICMLSFNGEYIAIAYYYKDAKEIIISD